MIFIGSYSKPRVNMKTLSILLVLFTLLISAVPAAHANPKKPALAIALQVDPVFRESFSEGLVGMLRTALHIVSLAPPVGFENSFFNWSGDPKLLENKQIEIHLSTSQSALVQNVRHAIGEGITTEDTFTLSMSDPQSKKMTIGLVILVDRILFDKTGAGHADGLQRLCAALAHEIYGNIQTMLSMDLNNIEPPTEEFRINSEIKAYTAAVRFLESIDTHPSFASLPEVEKAKFRNLLPQEKEALKSWEDAHAEKCKKPLVN